MYSNIIILNQLLFFIMCDILFCAHNESERKTNPFNEPNDGPLSLLFYYVLTCIIIKFVEIYNIYIVIPITSPTRRRSVLVCVLKLIIEIIKTIFILTCLDEQGLLPKPNLIYTIITTAYYLCTEPFYVRAFPSFLKTFNIKKFEGLECVYAPVILCIFHTTLCSILLAFTMFTTHYFLAMFILYYAIISNFRLMKSKLMRRLEKERSLLNRFREATNEEIAECKDVCAICLQPLETARVTNCVHLFHADCLRKWCKLSNECPMCKTFLYGPIIFDVN